MGLFERFTHSEEIQKFQEDAEQKFNAANEELEKQKNKTSGSLESLGKAKVDAWSRDMTEFFNAFNAFNYIEVSKIPTSEKERFNPHMDETQMLINIKDASSTAREIVKAGAISLGAGALVGIASYGGAMMFGHASTGTAIATLKGIAKKNATLAWFGGGSLSSGGLGIAGGKLVIAGLSIIPMLAVGGTIAFFMGKAKLAEAKAKHAETIETVEKMKIVTCELASIESVSKRYTDFIDKLHRKFEPFLKAVKMMYNSHLLSDDGTIDFDTLTEVEQRTLHVSWLFAQLYYQILAVTLLTESGEVSTEAEQAICKSEVCLKRIEEETYAKNSDETLVSEIFWRAKNRRICVIGYVLAAALIAIGVVLIPKHTLASITSFVCAVIACPHFFALNHLSAPQKYLIRIAKLFIAIVLSVIMCCV